MKVKFRERSAYYSGVKTIVCGIRAEKSFFELCDKVAEQKGVTRNNLITSVVETYCKQEIAK